jgi:antitoxin ParD1/3/4
MAAALRQTVEGGEYVSTSEIVREAVREWTRRRDDERRDLEALREAIRIGLEGAPSVPAKTVFAELRARYAAHTDIPGALGILARAGRGAAPVNGDELLES